jgi:hypothetical protein
MIIHHAGLEICYVRSSNHKDRKKETKTEQHEFSNVKIGNQFTCISSVGHLIILGKREIGK